MQYLWKSGDCQLDNCPALLETEDNYFVIGTDITAAELAEVEAAAAGAGSGIGAGETVVKLPKDILDRLAQRS